MDYQSYHYPPQENKRRSQKMERTALILGIIAIATPCLVYPSLICGALGIMFALLSRGGEQKLENRAKIGLTLSSIGLGVVIFMLVCTLVFAHLYYGGIENMARDVYESMGIDFDILMQSMYGN